MGFVASNQTLNKKISCKDYPKVTRIPLIELLSKLLDRKGAGS